MRAMKRKSFTVRLLLSFSLALVVFLAFSSLPGCCFSCLVARSELAGQKDLEQLNPRATNIWAGDIEAIITSEYGGNLESFTVDGVSSLVQVQNYYNSDLLISCDTGRQVGIKNITKYDNAAESIVSISSELTKESLSLEKIFRMNFDTGDIFVEKEIINLSDTPVNVDVIQKLNLAKGGFFLIPINVASRYPNLYKIVDVSGNDITSEISQNVLRTGNKIAYYVSGETEMTIAADSSEGWFGYFYKDTILLVKFSPFYTSMEKKNVIIFKADVTKESVICSFGETSRTLPEQGSSLIMRNKFVIIKLRNEIKNFDDIQEALDYLKINLILRR